MSSWTKDQLRQHPKSDSLLGGRAIAQVLKPKKLEVPEHLRPVAPPASTVILNFGGRDFQFNVYRFTVPGEPISKPRMTRGDRYQKRPRGDRYRLWVEKCRAAAGVLPLRPDGIQIVAYISIAKSWSRKKQAELLGQPHQIDPDADNLLKSPGDALFKEDSSIWCAGPALKFWCLPGQERMDVSVLYRA